MSGARFRRLGRTGRALRALLVATLGALPGAGASAAQDGGTIRGLVLEDGSGVPVSGARIVLEGPDTLTVESGRDGRWTVARAAPGHYAVTVSRIGYDTRTFVARLPTDDEVRLELPSRALPLDAVVVTASRRPQRLADAPVAVEVFQAEDLRLSGASDLASVLTERTGLQLEGGHPSGAGVMLQGMDSERVLVLVDGQPWVGRISGTSDLSRIPVSAVERVEIVKGPQATLYGSEAMGGVVNVITRAPDGEWSGSASVTSGSHDRLDASGRLSGRAAGLDFGVDVGRRAEDLMPGRSADGDASVRRMDGHARVSWAARRGLALEGSALVVGEEQRWRSGQLRHFGDNVQGALTFEGRWTGGTQSVSAVLHGSRFDHLHRRGTRDTPPSESAGDRQVQSLGELDLSWGWADQGPLELDLGTEVGHERIDAETVSAGDSRRTSVESYGQATLALGRATFVPGLRFSHSTRWGGHWTPRLAVMVRPTSVLAVRASVSAGYRAPSFKELGLDFLNSGPGFGYLVRGNPHLEPETSTNLSAGVEWAGSRTYARLQAFHNDFNGFIETRALADSAGLTVFTYGNIAEGHTAGIEVETGWSPGVVDLELGYAWLTTEDDITGRPLLGRPEHSGRASLGLPLAALRGHIAGTWTGATPLSLDPETGATVVRDAFLRFDARLAYRPTDRIDLALGVDNVLDAAPSAWPGFAGRRLHLSVTSTLFGRTEP